MRIPHRLLILGMRTYAGLNELGANNGSRKVGIIGAL
jgi:hypothetical protein